ncbi:polysaccharide biosynthesis/export family protein [Yoonia tamlensis]|nr:polysaccharide biosynthesis/export family protein [Yoonia tamlensis]
MPGAGPTAQSLAQTQAPSAPMQTAGFIVAPISPQVIEAVSGRATQSLHGHFGATPAPQVFAVGIGDSLAVTLWEAGSGGLFASGTPETGSGANSVTFPVQEVDHDGAISVPYAGRVVVAGQTLAEIERRIVASLAGKAIDPQVIVTVTDNSSNFVTVSGTGVGGARIALSRGGDRLLDVIAAAGGAGEELHEVTVTLTRQGRIMSVPMDSVVRIPRENITVTRGDTISLTRTPRTFTALGATGQNALIPFDTLRLTLEKAVAKAGGLAQTRADPSGVFILRQEPAAIATVLDPAFVAAAGQSTVNVVYSADLRDPNSLFLARQFEILPDDILYVAGASANEFERFLRLVQLPFVTARVTTAGL